MTMNDVRRQASMFAEMLLCHGVVHADPHAGNLYCRATPGGGTQLCLLDHGLYHNLKNETRQELARLWHAPPSPSESPTFTRDPCCARGCVCA